MAKPPILTLTDIRLGFGGAPLFEGVTFSVAEGDRLCLVGRNGSGKSTLMKLAAGLVAADDGERFAQPGAKISYLSQDPSFAGFATLGDYAAADLGPDERYRAEMAMEGLKVQADADPARASGGERRRAALARLLAGEPDLMLLDEPTNHLDIAAIRWLEEMLSGTRAGFVLISHDRAFLRALTRGTLWLDRGVMRRHDRGFDAFEDWRDKTHEEEDATLHKLDRKIKREEHWVTHGVSGRRKRNVRRMAELAGLRETRRTHLRRAGGAAMALDSGGTSGKRVIETVDIRKAYGGRLIVNGFTTRILRGDRVAIVGPNGAGKTTLLRLLTGEVSPDDGKVIHGTGIVTAMLDQNRDLDPEKSLWETLTEDKLIGVKGGNDQVMVRGRPKHVVGYLKEFLFDERQARGPVGALSGGEKARLMLARIMARESNLLILDEPTNDLDMETLDLLQEVLSDYDGTLLLVSHDRDFIDRIATSTIAMEGDGSVIEYAGGWSDYRAQRGDDAPIPVAAPKASAVRPEPAKPKEQRKLSFRQKTRLEALPDEMARFEADIIRLEALLADPDLYARDPARFDKATAALAQRRGALEAAEEEWLELEALREELGA